jgi:hypothetical protein
MTDIDPGEIDPDVAVCLEKAWITSGGRNHPESYR